MRDVHEQLEQRGSRAKLKQRLVGAAVLLIVLAIFLPFIFNHSHLGASATAEQDNNAATASPTADNATDQAAQTSDQTAQTSQAPLNSAEQTLDSSAAQDEMAETDESVESDEAIQTMETAAQTQPSAAQAEEITTATQEQAAGQSSAAAQAALPSADAAQQAAPQPSAQPPAAPATAAIQTSQKATGHWIVQIASFSDPAHAKQLVNNLRHKGLHAYSQQVSPHLTRVYAGPVKTQQEAQTLQAQVKDEFQLSGLVLEKRA